MDKSEEGSVPGTMPQWGIALPFAIRKRLARLDAQSSIGIALIAASAIALAVAGVLLGPGPLSGSARWLGRGILQSSYVALFALFLWIFVARRRGVTYPFLVGIGCVGILVWDVSMGIYVNRLRLEANTVLTAFRNAPAEVIQLAGVLERNPYVEAYVTMRDAHWELRNRMDERLSDYRIAYANYVRQGDFLDIGRLRSRYELWRAYFQVDDLEKRLARIEGSPFDAGDLLWTVDLLHVDKETRDAYEDDLKADIAKVTAAQTELLRGERRTLARIKRSLKVLIHSAGRYRFAEGRVVFEDPADAALFAGNNPTAD
jgi:hypothetical protein